MVYMTISLAQDSWNVRTATHPKLEDAENAGGKEPFMDWNSNKEADSRSLFFYGQSTSKGDSSQLSFFWYLYILPVQSHINNKRLNLIQQDTLVEFRMISDRQLYQTARSLFMRKLTELSAFMFFCNHFEYTSGGNHLRNDRGVFCCPLEQVKSHLFSYICFHQYWIHTFLERCGERIRGERLWKR